jgi:plastocyanin
MIRGYIWPIVFATMLMAADVHGASVTAKVGIIKGSITVDGKPTSDVVVSVVGIAPDVVKARSAALRKKKAEMDQRDMKFIPHVLPVLVGTTVDFQNHDKNWHNVYSKSDAKVFDLGLYAPGKSRSTTFDKAGVVRILCNVHPNMEAFIVVKDNPYFTSADQRGNYRLNDVPLGKYRVQVWHPQLGTTETGVDLVREGEVLDINFDLKKQ